VPAHFESFGADDLGLLFHLINPFGDAVSI
jgi:hypothetical protein